MFHKRRFQIPCVCLLYDITVVNSQFLPVPPALVRHDGASGARAGQLHGEPEVDGVLGVLAEHM